MKVSEIIELAKEYESLKQSADYTRHFLSQVEREGHDLTILSGGAELDIHPNYTSAFTQHIHSYLSSVDTRLNEIEDLLEANYAEGTP